MKRLDRRRRKLVEDRMGRAARIARGIRAHLPADERVAAAWYGLCKAASYWSPARGPFRLYAPKIVRRAVRNAIGRSTGRCGQLRIYSGMRFSEPVWQSDSFSIVDDRDEIDVWRRRLNAGLPRLTERQRQVIQLKRIGLGPTQIARQLGITREMAHRHWTLAREQLRAS